MENNCTGLVITDTIFWILFLTIIAIYLYYNLRGLLGVPSYNSLQRRLANEVYEKQMWRNLCGEYYRRLNIPNYTANKQAEQLLLTVLREYFNNEFAN